MHQAGSTVHTVVTSVVRRSAECRPLVLNKGVHRYGKCLPGYGNIQDDDISVIPAVGVSLTVRHFLQTHTDCGCFKIQKISNMFHSVSPPRKEFSGRVSHI